MATASHAMYICDGSCNSIGDFYANYSRYLESPYVENLILDAYQNCLDMASSNNGGTGDGGHPPPAPIQKWPTLKDPKILGKINVGQTLTARPGKWGGGVSAETPDWFVCKSSIAKPQYVVKILGFDFKIPANNCATGLSKRHYSFNGDIIDRSYTLKLLPKYRKKFVMLCQELGASDNEYWGYYCTPTVKVY